MFENYEKYYSNYVKYLLSLEGHLNLNEVESGFANIEIAIMHIYNHSLNNKYNAVYSEKLDNVSFIDTSLKSDELAKENKLETLYNYMYKEYSLIDTLKKIGRYVFFENMAYVFTDYGLIAIYGNTLEGRHLSKIRYMHIWVNSEDDKNKLEEFVNSCLVEISSGEKQKNLIICTMSSYGFRESALEVKPFDCNIEENYNDDVPYDKITELIKEENEHLILLHGEPGTGKTSIIKKLIRDNPKTEFIYFDLNLLTSFSDGKIFDFLIEHKQQVFIIEDCEKLFIDRNNGNQFLNSMLNLTDGIIGEAFGIKFICTFNCPVNKIDKAVLREGRLSLIYEFKKLSLEKTKHLLPSATEPMTLAEIYNTDDNGNKNKDKKIGF